MERASLALAPSRPQVPWLALPSKQRGLVQVTDACRESQSKWGSQSEAGMCAHGHGVAMGHLCQAHILGPKCGSGQHRQ